MFVGSKTTKDKSVVEIKTSSKRQKLAKMFSSDIDFFGSDNILKTEEFKKADIVHCHNLHGWYFKLSTLKKISKIKPVVWTLHDEWAIMPSGAYDNGMPPKKGLYARSSIKTYPEMKFNNSAYLGIKKKYIYKKTKLNIVSPSGWLMSKIINTPLATKNVKLINNGVDASIFKPAIDTDLKKSLGIKANKKVVITVSNGGKDNEFKGSDYFEKVASHYKDNKNIEFISIGGKFNKFDTKSNIRYVKYLGDETILSQYFALADVFLFTSSAENFPLVTLEAMSCGTPVVTFDVGGTKEPIIHKKDGYIARAGNHFDLIDGIDFITSLKPQDRKALSKRLRQKVIKNYSIEFMTDNYLELYKQLIQDRKLHA